MSTPAALVLTSGATAVVYRPSTTTVTVKPTGSPISGTNGTNGADGKSIRTGTGAPTTGTFNTGDLYLDLLYPQNLYGPRAGDGTWPLIGPLVGPQGPSGSGVHGFFTMGA